MEVPPRPTGDLTLVCLGMQAIEQVDELKQGRPGDLAHARLPDLPKDGQDRGLNAGRDVGHGSGG